MIVLKIIPLLLPVLGIGISYLWLKKKSRSKEALLRLLFCALLGALCSDIHYMQVDKANLHKEETNEMWQLKLHKEVLAFEPGVIPHSYRFLPDYLVAGMEHFNGSYNTSRAIYRFTFQTLIFVALYIFARIFLIDAGALLALALYAAVYSVSIRFYNGQLIDPMSHLSFLLAFIFIHQRKYGALLATLLLGSLAKESVAAMALFGLYESRHNSKALLKSAGVLGLTILGLFVVRRLVLSANPGYQDMSGVSFDHIQRNWAYSKLWVRQFIFTFGIFLPFLILGWKRCPRYLRDLSLFLMPVLTLSNLLFSWMMESRNLVPLTFVLVVITANELLGRKPASSAT